jgi:enoyl-CoA hydratase/carnithine racemase
MAYELVIVERGVGWGQITLNRPKANALSLELVTDIAAAFAELQADSGVRCILITGAGDRFFSGGADIPTLQGSLGDPLAEGGLLATGLKLMNTIELSDKPVVAAVNGVAVGGGCELALACHMRIASANAQFGQPEIKLGIIPGWGGTHRLPRLIGEARALDWLLTGRMVGAEEALSSGLVCTVRPAGELAEAAQELGAAIGSKPAVAAAMTLKVVRERARHPEQGEALEAEAFGTAAKSADAAEGVAAFLEKRTPTFTGK